MHEKQSETLSEEESGLEHFDKLGRTRGRESKRVSIV
jgi:hypothetical protein